MLDFLKKEKLYTGIGEDISRATSTQEALEMAGLNWSVEPRTLFCYDPNGDQLEVVGHKAIARVEDDKVLGVVSDKYTEIQNKDAFDFTEELLDEGVEYVRGGSFHGGRSVWLMARMPENKIILGDPVEQYLVFTNAHDGSGAVRIMIAPKRIVCSNALNFFCKEATRKWSCRHMGDIEGKMVEAKETLIRTEAYMHALDGECERLQGIIVNDYEVGEVIRDIFPYSEKMSDRQKARIDEQRLQLSDVYYHKDDLTHLGNTAYRLVSAVSDYATHAEPKRRTKNQNDNLWEKVIGGHPMIDSVTRRFAA